MPVTVVYAIGSRQIRRVIVSDADVEPAMVDGEAALTVPFKEYVLLNADEVRQYVEAQIGPPIKDTRCVEVDRSGKVVAVYAADPDIDRPVFDARNTLELHKDAAVGEVKGHDGKFPVRPAIADDVTRPPVAGVHVVVGEIAP